MYERFYQLVTNPFRLEPDPNFCFSHPGYKRAREYLEYVLAQGEGFVMVTGRPGTGKTLLLETFIKEIDTSNLVAKRIAVSSYSGDDLLRAVAYAYDIDAAELDKATLRHVIHRYFIRQEQLGRRVLLIIDEAQALQHTALEELRILSDLQTQSRMSLQLFLVGQESLQDLMLSPDMEQFQQRVVANYQLAPLNLQDTRSYIEHRLLQAGWKYDPEFSGDAVVSIYQLSHGVPRHINKICNRLLLLGFGKGSHAFDEQDVQEISAEMHDERLTPLETDQTAIHDAATRRNVSEIRDGLIAIDDLAIGADKVDVNASGISAASRQSDITKQQFTGRHDNDSASGNVQQASPPERIGVPVTERYFSRFRSREMLVATAILTITAVSIAVLLPIPGENPGTNRLSQADHQTREDPNTMAGGLPVSPGDTATSGWKNNPEKAQLQENERQLVVAERAEYAINLDEYGPPAAGNMGSNALPQEEQLAMVARAMPLAPAAGSVEQGQAETIEQLLSRAQQSLDDFRLLTPEGDNAYGYYRAVLLLDPVNDDAYEGIQDIVDRYITLVRKAADQHEYARASRYITRGLSIQPTNRELLSLQDSIDRAIQSASADKTTVTHAEDTSLETTDPGDLPVEDSLIQGIKTFFQNRKAEAESGVVYTPAGWDD